MGIIITQEDFKLIGQLATHCDKEKLNMAIEEALMFDVEPLLCSMFIEIENNWTSTDEIWVDLINGSNYENCNEKKRRQAGVKSMILYYAYARYVVLNNFNDTPNGAVTKTNQFSIPKPLKEIEQFANKYRSMGYKVYKDVEDFMCINKDDYTEFNDYNCATCGCGDTCKEGTKAKGFGIKPKNVSRWDV